MKTDDTEHAEHTDSALVRQYLATVEREAGALPADRRQELVSDLAEHIEIALAERPGSGADILRALGDPRDIAATALQESGTRAGGTPATTKAPAEGKAARRRSPAWAVAWLPVPALAVAQLVPLLGFALRVTGAVMLCRSRYWTWEQKWIGLTATVIAPTLIAATTNLTHLPHGLPVWARWLAGGVSLVLAAGGAGWLWKVRKD